MESISSEFKVGLFTVIATLIIGYMFFMLSPDTFRSQSHTKYYTIVRDASGIITKTHVKTNGVIVGKVSAVELETNSTKIIIEIDSRVKIPEQSKITIKEKGLLGEVFVEILRANDTGKYYKEGDFIPPDEDHVGMSELIGIAGSIGKDVREITRSLSQVLGGEDGANNLRNIISDIRSISSELKNILQDNGSDIKSIIQDFRETSKSLRNVLVHSESDLRVMIANLRSFSDTAATMGTIENKERLNRILASFDNALQEMQSAASSVKSITKKIENGEGTIGRLVAEDGTITEIDQTIKEVRELIAPATRLKIDVDYHNEIGGNLRSQHFFNLKFRARPDRFYLLGMTDHRAQMREKTIEEIPDVKKGEDASTATKTRETIYLKQAIRFNLQYAKRWHFAQLRFGLFETTGGVASDFYLLDDKVQLSLEAYDWNDQDRFRKVAHVKAFMNVNIFGQIYGVFGMDDLTRIDYSSQEYLGPRYYFGAGFNFTDDDLKAFLGSASLVL